MARAIIGLGRCWNIYQSFGLAAVRCGCERFWLFAVAMWFSVFKTVGWYCIRQKGEKGNKLIRRIDCGDAQVRNLHQYTYNKRSTLKKLRDWNATVLVLQQNLQSHSLTYKVNQLLMCYPPVPVWSSHHHSSIWYYHQHHASTTKRLRYEYLEFDLIPLCHITLHIFPSILTLRSLPFSLLSCPHNGFFLFIPSLQAWPSTSAS